MSALSIVEHLGQIIKKDAIKVEHGFDYILPAAQTVCGIISIFDPAIGLAASNVLKLAVYVEGQFAAVGSENGTGTQKAAVVAGILSDDIAAALKAAGKPSAAADVQKFIATVVNIGKNDPNLLASLQAILSGNLSGVPAAPAVTA